MYMLYNYFFSFSIEIFIKKILWLSQNYQDHLKWMYLCIFFQNNSICFHDISEVPDFLQPTTILKIIFNVVLNQF